ncbi:MAG TPA: protein kinase, partial [Kofleriaceae bacterium]
MNPTVQRQCAVSVTMEGELALVRVSGLVDERFDGFGPLAGAKSLVLDVTEMTRMTSFGVRQWLRAMEGLRGIAETYLVGCPTFFVDQLNMVMNFGGTARVLTVVAPYMCNSCGIESSEIVDVLGERATLLKNEPPAKLCTRCSARLELDETPQSYFSFTTRYAAQGLSPGVADLLVRAGLYRAVESTNEKPPRIIKLVHNTVTYFRIIGTIGSMFRARPLLVGAEGEVVIDLAEVDRYEPTGFAEWRRLLKMLSTQVPTITLVDASEELLSRAADTITPIRNLALWSMLVRYRCVDCGRIAQESVTLPLRPGTRVCASCGGETRGELEHPQLAGRIATPPASAKMIQQRAEVLSRAVTDAAVARAGSNATATLVEDDTILGKYKIVRRLSEGGMAEVFLAKQIGLGGFEKPVALKRIQRQLLESRHLAIDMFLNEAKIVGRLLHPNIVQVLDVGELNGALYLAMEYVNGKDLRQIVKRLRRSQTTMPLGVVCFVIREIATALHHAFWSVDMAGNQLSVVHRDVTPHNVIISWDGSVKLLDFGVAMSSVTESSTPIIVGKWLYMSPEATSNAALDHRSDLFSLGVVTYLLCTGNLPFTGADPSSIVQAIRAGQFRPL